MARVTVEDCVLRIPNRFDLVMLAAQRARDISAGGQLTLNRDNDKNPVVALREVAEGTIDTETLANSLVQGLQKHVETDEPEEEGGFGAGAGDVLGDLMQPQVPQGAEAEELSEDELAEVDLEEEESLPEEPGDLGDLDEEPRP